MRPKPVAYFLCAVSIALIALCPFILTAQNRWAAETPPYKGILTLWHITRWRSGSISLETYLRKRIREFEKDYAYAFIELTALTEAEAQEALAAGESPDLISYPLYGNPGVALQELPFSKTILPCAVEDASPYACGGYCVLINTDLLTAQGADIPKNGWGLRPDALADAARFAACFDAEPGCSALPALALHAYPKSGETDYSTWGDPEPPDAMLSLAPAALDNGLAAFLSGEAAVLIASHRQLYEAEQAYLHGNGPAFLAYAIGGYTDMAQKIGVAACDDDKKISACFTFVQYLLSAYAQRKLEACGVLPVMEGLDIYAEDECRRAMYDLLCKSAALPKKNEAQELDIRSAKALGGDERALKELKKMLGG